MRLGTAAEKTPITSPRIVTARIGLRAIAYLAIATVYVSAMPDHPRLAYESWFAATIGRSGIPHTLGGENYASAHDPWAAPGWLGALVGAGLLQTFGLVGYQLASAAFACAAAAALEYVARAQGATGILAASAGVMVLPAWADALRAGSLLSSLAPAPLLVAGAVVLLPARARIYVVAAPIFTLLWCELSPCGLFAPAIAAGVFLAYRSRASGLAALLCGVAAFCTPGGPLFVAGAFAELKLDAVLGAFGNPDYDRAPFPIATTLALPACAIALALCARRKRAAPTLLAIAATFALVVANGAYFPLLGCVTVAVVLPEANRLGRMGSAIALGGALLGSVAVALASTARDAIAGDRYTDQSALIASARAHGSRRLVCTLVVWCDESLRDGPPTYADDRFDAIPWLAYRDVYRLRFMSRGWPTAMRHAGPDALLVVRTEPPVQILGTTPGWRVVACSQTACLILRTHRP